jgi:hypothetical protein
MNQIVIERAHLPLRGRFGVIERVRGTLERIGVLHTLGAANVVATDPHLLAAIEQGRDRAPHRMSQQRARPGNRDGAAASSCAFRTHPHPSGRRITSWLTRRPRPRSSASTTRLTSTTRGAV